MKQRYKDIGVALLFITVTHLLSWLVAFGDGALQGTFDALILPCFLLYWIGILPFYFCMKHFAANNVLFWSIVFAFHLVFSFVSFCLIKQFIVPWHAFAYSVSLQFTLLITLGALLLDLIIETVKRIIKRKSS